MKKHEAGELARGRPVTPDRRAYEVKIAGLERKVGQLTMELDLLKNDRVHGQAGFQAVPVRSMALSVTTSLRTQAVSASLAGFPAVRRRS